jgi:GTP-binding protein
LKRSTKGAIISVGNGKITNHALKSNEEHGLLYVSPGEETYNGHVIGELNKEGEVEVNPTKEKATSNIRTTSKEEYIKLSPPKILVLEDVMVSLRNDELLEVTPKSLRIRKKILDSSARRKYKRENKHEDE